MLARNRRRLSRSPRALQHAAKHSLALGERRDILAVSSTRNACSDGQTMRKQQQITRDAILQRINEIDRKFLATEPGLHSMLSKLAREREELVALANERFDARLKHEWR